MPKILEDLRKKIGAKEGVSKSSSYAIATAALQKQGKLKKGTQEMTPKGRAYQQGKRGR